MTPPPSGRSAMLRVDQLQFHPRNVRTDLGDLRELAASIAEVGVLEPLLVEDLGTRGRVLAGHRRLTAARMAGLKRVPCMLVAPHSDEDAIVTMVSENRHRRAMSPAEKTAAARTLRDEFGWSQARIGQRLGVSAVTISRWLAGDNEDDGPTVMKPAPAPGDLGAVAAAASRAAAQVRRTRVQAAQGNGRHRKTIGLARLRDVVDRWEGKAPPALLRELRDLAGGPA